MEMGWGLLHLFPRPVGLREAGRGWALLHHTLLPVQGGLEAHGFCLLAQQVLVYAFLPPRVGAGLEGGGERDGGKGQGSEAMGLQVQGDRGCRRLHLLLEPVEVLGRAPQPGLQFLQQPEVIHLLEEVTVGRARRPGGLSPGQRLGQRVAQSCHDTRDAAQQALEAGAEVGQAAAQLSRGGLAVEATQVAQEVAVGLVVLGQPQSVVEASPHVQVDSGPGQSLRPEPRWVEVRLVERGAQVVQL